MVNEWEYNVKEILIWYNQLPVGVEFTLVILDWHEQISPYYNNISKTNPLLIKGVSKTKITTKEFHINVNDAVKLSLWQGGFFSKWEQCQNRDFLDKRLPITLSLRRTSKTNWEFTKIKQPKSAEEEYDGTTI